MRVAFVTDSTRPNLTADDRLVVAPLRALGIEVVPLCWGSDPQIDLTAAVIRSPWDYHHHLPAFLLWIDQLSLPIWNSPDVLRWNVVKTYLTVLESRGVPVIPTVRVGAGDNLGAAIAGRGWRSDEVVVKPEVSGGGHATWRFDPVDIARVAEVSAGMRAAGGVFHLQPFLRDVGTHGELSLVWFDGHYSHALQKRPAAGGFLVQAEHGGTSVPTDAPAEARVVAERALAAVGTELLYARVDLLRDGDAWFVIEVELVEPELFLRHHPEAPDRFARAVDRWARRVAG
jgi:glutathione synthase/RimK-type ligase-like ATP-grasp enzyme